MDNRKPVYLLAGGRGGKDTTIIRIMKEIAAQSGVASPSIAYVGAASGDNKAFYLFISTMLKRAGSGKVNHAVLSNKKPNLDKAKAIIETSDAVFISGGDVEAGMEVLEKVNMTGYFRDLYINGKVFFGASAGSIMLAKEWVRWNDPDDDSTANIFPCMELAPVVCDTHAEDDGWEELKILLGMKENHAEGFGIASGTCLKVYPDGKVEALGGPVARFAGIKGKVEQNPDLNPE
jgi:cyanophycinase-like exopeptidase